ncbi:MAG: hypothetical protein U9P71_01390 [Campylobacterota bacterium]|nr:hypothetical protein [Campylobacterota bacterium]
MLAILLMGLVVSATLYLFYRVTFEPLKKSNGMENKSYTFKIE